MVSRNINFGKKLTFFILPLILLIYGVIMARDFLYPLSFGMLLAYLLFPLANYFEKHKFPRILAILISIIIAFVVLLLAGWLFYNQIAKMVDDFPVLKERALQNIEAMQHTFEEWFNMNDDSLEKFLKQQVNTLFALGNNTFANLFTSTTGTIVRIALLPVYVFLFLFYRTKFAIFILNIVPEGTELVAIRILKEISQVASKYMGGVFIVVSILCVLNSLGLFIIGMRYALILGIISAILNFIPYFGTLIGGSVPLIFAFLIHNPIMALRVVILFIIIQFTENNILTPNIVGGNVKISPFFIITGLVMASMIWGIPGMIVIIPVLAIIKIIFENIEGLQPYAFLLGVGGTRKHSITVENMKRVFRSFKNIFLR